ncbi:MAG: nucleoside triphosphate pyrophosphohydrolase [Candidatus Liptonbacteria bacterium]|nr:nucleoside triphosphate pyrophosphohydrolase [Candidatus Liptonbacteria bacterium]
MSFTHTNYKFEREYPKLVRDRIPEIEKRQGGESARFRVIQDGEEFFDYLAKKLIEESMELRKSKVHGNFEEELADIFEVLDAILRLKKKTRRGIAAVQKKKRKERGGFKKRVLMLPRP